ncbi:MAG: hypothetical protein J5699_09020 [Bacteroidales bacterium]|nr:hypothetical protein [Bacteroidales bacterium]
MKKTFRNILLAAGVVMLAASCNNAAKMAEAAEQIKIKCVPEVLEVVADKIDATISVNFPADYFLPKATLEVTPVILYVGGEAVGKPFTYQGDKVADNYKVVDHKNGATITEKVSFDYVPGMEKSELVARAKVYYKGNEYVYPADIKIADGANTTYMLVDRSGKENLPLLADNYMEVIPMQEEAQILYKVNSSEVRNSELKSADIANFLNALKALQDDARKNVKGTEIVAYASPEGPIGLNNKLSADREKSAKKAFEKLTKKVDAGNVSTRSIGEDWEGFKELVEKSNIEDKDLILRVLSMYSDPNVREREIKNMSSVYTSLADEILPELRRARFITNVEYTNYTAEELTDLLENNANVLDEEALLRAATLVKDNDAKLAAYKKAIAKFDSDRAKYNAAVISLLKNEDNNAKDYLKAINDKTGDAYNNIMGVVAMRAGNNDEAARYFDKAGKVANENAAVIDILNGKYADAAAKLKDVNNHNAVLAAILNNDLKTASDKAASHNCMRMAYYKAIIAARKGDVETAKSELAKASANKAFAERAEKDVEFAHVK